MYVQQRDEYLEHVCEMAIRKISIITIFGTLTNSTMKIDHYQLGEPKVPNIYFCIKCSKRLIIDKDNHNNTVDMLTSLYYSFLHFVF